MTQVVVISSGTLRQEIWAGEHTLVSDEPREFGGENAGPTPYELLLAALGACTSITLQMYAQRRNWELEAVEVRLTHDRIHARDCAECEEKEGYLERIEKAIVVSGNLSAEQVERLGKIAEMCPVNRTLRASVETKQQIRLAEASSDLGTPTAG